MRIAVFGASGKTGRLVIEQGLERGHEMVAFVRDRSRFDRSNELLEVVGGDARDPDDVVPALRGSDAAISVISLARPEDEPQHSEATRTIVEAAKTEGVRRIVVTTNNHVFHDDEVPPELAAFAREHRRNRDLLRSSGLDWTIVASPTLADDESTGSYAAAVDEKAPGKTDGSSGPRGRGARRARPPRLDRTHRRGVELDAASHRRARTAHGGPTDAREARCAAVRRQPSSLRPVQELQVRREVGRPVRCQRRRLLSAR